MLVEPTSLRESPACRLIQTPPEKPIRFREWVQAAVHLTLFAFVALPFWTALSLLSLGPAMLLKKYSSHFSRAAQKQIDRFYVFSTGIFPLLQMSARHIPAYYKPPQHTLGKGRPILLVHGYLNNSSVWHSYIKKLAKWGFGPLYSINLGHPFLSLSQYATNIQAKAEAIYKETGRRDLILIGHSMGGLVSALYATKLAPVGSVTDVFTLGSPLNGAPLAEKLGFGPNGREMTPKAEILTEIRQAIQANQHTIRFYHVGSDADALVPKESALSTSGKHLSVSDAGHTHLLISKKISDWICSQLQNHA